MQVEIGTGTSVNRGWNNAWINTYSDNCNPANFIPSSPTLSSPQNTNHIKMTQIGIVHGYFESIVSNGGESGGGGSLISGGLSHDCAEQTDYYFRTDVEGAKLILDVETTTKGHYQYLSFFNHSINLHQKTKVDADLTVSGSSNLQAVTATSITATSLNVDNFSLAKLSIGVKKPTGAAFTNCSLSVDGTIVAKEMITQATSWADKVFQKNYRLSTLSELESFILTNKHLPEIPSEKEIIENGISVNEMLKLQMQKIEELTLYVIQQQKEIDLLKKSSK